MENVNIVLAANILKYRKKSGLSQDELAQKLGVTFQAVSKWENAKAAPDITFLPIMADIFGCYIDEKGNRHKLLFAVVQLSFYHMYRICDLLTNERWAWFNSVRDTEKFQAAVEWAREMEKMQESEL